MTAAQTEEFVAKALSHAMARDGSSGGVCRTITVTKDGAEKTMEPIVERTGLEKPLGALVM